ncbi:MAG TPA: cytochrome C oxidase subunit IV family protein [Pseudonocardia sp.]|jgi:hypothetical protein|nr:cytochrome C oxidase subunit IV family protein [Pseudonocardia sp.]
MISYLPVLLRQRATAAWAVLMLATVISWSLGTHHGPALHDPRFAATGVIVIAFIKVHLVGRHFMELREAPRALVLWFDGWVVAVCAVVAGLYLWA